MAETSRSEGKWLAKLKEPQVLSRWKWFDDGSGFGFEGPFRCVVEVELESKSMRVQADRRLAKPFG